MSVYAKLHEVDHVLSDFVPKLLEIRVGVFGEVTKSVLDKSKRLVWIGLRFVAPYGWGWYEFTIVDVPTLTTGISSVTS